MAARLRPSGLHCQFLLLLTTLTILSTATPIPEATNNTISSLALRSTPGVYICSSELFTGTCSLFSPPLAPHRSDGLILGPDLPCNPLPYTTSQTISFGPDHDVICIVFKTEACDPAGHQEYTWPGSDYLPGPGNVDLETGATDGRFRSYGCRGSIDLG